MQAYGFQISSDPSPTSFQSQLLDDHFDFSDDEGPTWEEKIGSVMDDTISSRKDVREEAFRAIAQWAASSPACHEALAEGFVNRADEFFALFCTHSQATVAETCPFAAAMRKLSEGCSPETRRKLLQSRLSTILDVASKAIFPTAIANDFRVAMRFLGKTEISNQIDICSTKMSSTCKILQGKLGEGVNPVDAATVMKGDAGLKFEEKVQQVLNEKVALQALHKIEVSNQIGGFVPV
jgi:hypothetical protein